MVYLLTIFYVLSFKNFFIMNAHYFCNKSKKNKNKKPKSWRTQTVPQCSTRAERWEAEGPRAASRKGRFPRETPPAACVMFRFPSRVPPACPSPVVAHDNQHVDTLRTSLVLSRVEGGVRNGLRSRRCPGLQRWNPGSVLGSGDTWKGLRHLKAE